MSTDSLVGGSAAVNSVSQEEWLERSKAVMMNTYASHPIVLTHGKGSYVTDASGKTYLDFISGIAVNALGHAPDALIEALTAQAAQLGHCSNLFPNIPGIKLAEELIAGSDFERAFFCNSGTEAIEASLKLSRKYAKKTKSENCCTIVTMSNSFHGRTYGSLSLTGQKKYQAGYAPLVPDVQMIEFNQLDDLQKLNLDAIAAIIVEPIQGEGGIHSVEKAYLQEVRKICDLHDIVLIYDEIQCGIGRTGTFFAYEQFGVAPDVIALAKGLGGGFPVGAILTTNKIASAFAHGDHGSTFGGNPLACAVALECVKTIKSPGFLANVSARGTSLTNQITRLMDELSIVKEVRGLGLLLGIELAVPVKPIISNCINEGLLLVGAGDHVIRVLPPLTVSESEITKAVSILGDVLRKESQSGGA